MIGNASEFCYIVHVQSEEYILCKAPQFVVAIDSLHKALCFWPAITTRRCSAHCHGDSGKLRLEISVTAQPGVTQ